MKNITNLSLVILITLLVGCGGSSTTSSTSEINGFWQDLEQNEMVQIKNNSIYRYTYYKDKVHGAGGNCYSNYQIATIESNSTEPYILKYLYYNDARFSYSGPIKIVQNKNELKFLRKYSDEYNQEDEVVKDYERLQLSDDDVKICNFSDRVGGITNINQLEGLWKLPKDFQFEPSEEDVEYWLISNNANVSSLIYDYTSQCYAKLDNYYFVYNIYNDGRLNLIYDIGTSPGHAISKVVLTSISNNILTFFGFHSNDINSLMREDNSSIELCNE